ncbi:MAG: DUF1622 domain-containing protein [bacterium]|nr:DUF1622 domain-containing protein [bacterium]
MFSLDWFHPFFIAFSAVFEIIGLIFILMAGVRAAFGYVVSMQQRKELLSLSQKQYHQLRSTFVHQVILALDFFLVAELIQSTFATDPNVLIEILLIVVIRSVLSIVLMKELSMKEVK